MAENKIVNRVLAPLGEILRVDLGDFRIDVVEGRNEQTLMWHVPDLFPGEFFLGEWDSEMVAGIALWKAERGSATRMTLGRTLDAVWAVMNPDQPLTKWGPKFADAQKRSSAVGAGMASTLKSWVRAQRPWGYFKVNQGGRGGDGVGWNEVSSLLAAMANAGAGRGEEVRLYPRVRTEIELLYEEDGAEFVWGTLVPQLLEVSHHTVAFRDRDGTLHGRGAASEGHPEAALFVATRDSTDSNSSLWQTELGRLIQLRKNNGMPLVGVAPLKLPGDAVGRLEERAVQLVSAKKQRSSQPVYSQSSVTWPLATLRMLFTGS